jgi:hypothetical protein
MKSIPIASSGSATSSPQDTSPTETLTEETSETLMRQISEDIAKHISSLASADGPSLSDLPDGLTLDLFGPDHVPASPSAPPVKAKHQAMNAICGPLGTSLSDLADRQSALANKLKRQLDGAGSTLFTLTWKQKATPLGRPYYQLAASGRRISDSDCGSSQHWTTPQAHDSSPRGKNQKAKHGTKYGNACLARDAEKSSWPTPMAGTPAQNGNNEAGNNDSSRKTVSLAPWPTPTEGDRKASGSRNTPQSKAHSGVSLTDAAMAAAWPTPQVDSFRSRSGDRKNEMGLDQLARSTAAWPSPKANNATGAGTRGDGADLQTVAIGAGRSSSHAQTENKGQLNPRFSGWMMGYPIEWDMCAPVKVSSSRRSSPKASPVSPGCGPTGTPSSRRLLRNL